MHVLKVHKYLFVIGYHFLQFLPAGIQKERLLKNQIFPLEFPQEETIDNKKDIHLLNIIIS